ncbi:hypothetical protein [Desulfofustis glycolicus]|uniref:DUF1439 domain-containing protein n=1 Tax=Desulfofustis glycolicus DSM 9705 TaxID=1121409 RepID=A0A1M5V0Z7_9BACT|nr:hypothetical protein [Desulfofustis glycolicus]MCB2215998.1 hypothetical protein [Desulfobulbaceae bacterium]SHH68830.1 hypothetical protein SAMN02745124_01459 [Desulfofustis glycolicus DSM 9705]
MRLTYLVFSILVLLFGATGRSAADSEPVTLHLPEATLADILHKTLPIPIDQPDGSLTGSITVTSIDELQLSDGSVSALIGLTGSDLQVNTSIAGHQLRVNIGSADLDFALTATLRYDRPQQTLFIVPRVSQQNDGQATGQASDTAALLAGLFNGREFPVIIDRLEPLVTETGDRKLTVDLQPVDIAAVPQALVLSLQPVVTVSPIGQP